MKTEIGVMIVKGGKAWGVAYEDAMETNWRFIDVEEAEIFDPRYVKNPTDVTYKDSPYVAELSGAKLVKIIRTTTVAPLPDN
jgi:hypothetical protein